MEKNGMVKNFLTVALLIIAVIGLTMQGTSVFAETLQPEGQSEATEIQPESLEETSEDGESEEQTETVEEQSVSGNDISEEETEDPDGIIEILAGEGTETENELKLTDEILKKCIVKGTNPSGVTVNLFDYSQGIAPDGSSEVAHDYYYNWSGESDGNKIPVVGKDPYVTTYNLGISKNHLLRFGYRGDETHDYCQTTTIDGTKLGDYGDWNEYHTVRYPGIVQKKLYNGYPRLNLVLLKETDFGRYADNANSATYFTENNKIESLAYLFSPNSTTYKASYSAVQGLFQRRTDGYYYYDSQKNFASFNKYTNSFTLYNSSGVAKDADGKKSYGQFFPFNTAYDVFDSYIDDDGRYQLTYQNVINPGKFDYDPITDGGNSYIKCYAPNLNHYFGLTLEMRFVQPAGGCVTGSTDEPAPMIFSFSGDDDVWIFIDGVLVADLGGLHDALGLSINFATGVVTVAGETQTLRQAFVTAYGEDSIPSSVKFSEENENTFADNTVHTLKMFYLERGHMASNLSLSFNIQPLPSQPSNNEDEDEEFDETEESTPDSDTYTSVSDNTLYDSTEIPKTGDDSLIGWWAALCIISLVGIGATVCNLIIRKRKHK